MATTVARLQAVLGADTRGFDRAMNQSETRMHRAGRAAGILGGILAGALAVGAKHAISDASDLHEQINKTEVVFRKNGKAVVEWGNHLAKSFGLSDRAALQYAATFGNMLKPMGISIEKTTVMSKRLTELAGDMASFNNASIDDTLRAIQSGLANQVRPLRQYGVFLDQTRIKLEAVNLGIVHAQVDTAKLTVERIKLNDATKAAGEALAKHGKGSEEYAKAAAQVAYEESKVQKLLEGKVPELTAAQKAQAAYSLIVRDTADAHGDFTRTAGGLANQQRILEAEYENVSAQLGTALLPLMTKLMGLLLVILGYLQKHTKQTKLLAIALGALAAALLAAAAAQTLMNLAVLANPYVAATVALVALTAAMYVLTARSKTARIVIEGLAVAIGLGLIVAVVELIRNFNSVSSAIKGAAGAITGVLSGAVRGINAQIHGMVRALEKVVDAFKWIVDNAKKIGGVLGGIGGALGGAAGKLNPFGDAVRSAGSAAGHGTTKGAAAAGRQFNIGRQLWDEIAIGQKFGLRVTSGYRPGAVTKHGTPSDHGRNPSAAVDMSGSAQGMASTFMALVGRREVRQAFYDPLGSIFGGVRSTYREGGHSDHIHIAEYDKGGFLRPGWNLAYNGLGRPEPVGGGNITIPISIGGEHMVTVVFDMLRRKAKVFENRNGRPAFGGA